MKKIQMEASVRLAVICGLDLKKYLSKSRLKLRGWSERMIRQFLGLPDGTFHNPACPARPKLLYEKKRVFAAERTAACKAAARKASIRRILSQRAAEKRVEQTLKAATDVPLVVPDYRIAALKKAAIEGLRPGSRDVRFRNAERLREFMVTFLYRQIYPREFVAAIIERQPGASDATRVLDLRQRRAIAAKYPKLVRGLFGYSKDELKPQIWERSLVTNKAAAGA